MFQEDTETADCWGSVQSFLYLTAIFSESLECGRTLRDTHCCFRSHYPWQTTNLQKIDEVQSWPRRPGTVLIRQLLLQHILSLTPSILFTACFHTEEEQSRSHRTRENHVAPCPPARRAVLKTGNHEIYSQSPLQPRQLCGRPAGHQCRHVSSNLSYLEYSERATGRRAELRANCAAVTNLSLYEHKVIRCSVSRVGTCATSLSVMWTVRWTSSSSPHSTS